MNADFYVCAVVLSAGTRRTFLRHTWVPTPHMAVRWLREEAIRTAGLVDPEPDAKWLRGGRAVLVSPTPGSPDVPQVLRDWADDEALQGAAMAVLAKREFFHFYTSDGQTGYSLSAMPLPVGFAGDWAAEIGAPSTA